MIMFIKNKLQFFNIKMAILRNYLFPDLSLYNFFLLFRSQNIAGDFSNILYKISIGSNGYLEPNYL